jgi:hypothetical protein
VRKFDIDVRAGDSQFRFNICQRTLTLGPAGEVDYFWLDDREFRRRGGGQNLRNCIHLWWAAVCDEAADREPQNETTLVLAETFPIQCTSRAMQSVYRDAHPHPRADRSEVKNSAGATIGFERTWDLPVEEHRQLLDVARSRDTARVTREFEKLFLGELPPQREMPAFQEAFRRWCGNGVVALRKGGVTQLNQYIEGELSPWISKLRKRGGTGRARRFLNLFIYECKCAFYLCYTSAWVAILQQLEEDGALTGPGVKLHQIWHCQNQALGQERGSSGNGRDALCGHILAQHPLSAFALNEVEHQERIGKFLIEDVHSNEEFASSVSYWDMVGTLLISAAEYRHAIRISEVRRKTRPVQSESPAIAIDSAAPSTADVDDWLNGFALSRELKCQQCAGTLICQRLLDEPVAVTMALVEYECQDCRLVRRVLVDQEEFEEFLRIQ